MSYIDSRYIFTSLTRISDLHERGFAVGRLPRAQWSTGDYVVARVVDPSGSAYRVELHNGRMMEVMEGDLLIGAFGHRFATLEATGTWEEVGEDGAMHLLTGAGLFGKLTSKSFYISHLIELKYVGHVQRNGKHLNMKDFAPDVQLLKLDMPVVLIVGTSMSAGKTTVARIIIRQLKLAGRKVIGAKLSGAGRYRDILSMKDAGADYIFDFVDVGLPSTIAPENEYIEAARKLLSMIAATKADVAVVEIGSSPLEPYNGNLAIRGIARHIKCVVLCASDPYAVYGVMKSFNMKPDIVGGVATNTLGGKALIEKLCGVKALNLVDPKDLPEVKAILSDKLELNIIDST